MSAHTNKTVNESISAVKDKLGGREQGYIGNTAIDTAVLQALQQSMSVMLQMYDPLCLRRRVKYTLDTSGRRILWPHIDTEDTIVKTKKIKDIRCRETKGETAWRIIPLTENNRIRWYSNGSEYEEHTGRPKHYIFVKRFDGRVGVDVYPFPDKTYYITALVDVYPFPLQVDEDLHLTYEWSAPLEALATSTCFYKLQELESGTFWKQEYRTLVRQVVGEENREMTKQLTALNQGDSINHEGTDPFVYNNEAPQW